MENLSPDKLLAYFNETVKMLKLKQLPEARERFLNILEVNPKLAEAYLNLGNIDFVEKNYDQAIDNYEKALRIDPVLSNGYINIGNCYCKKDLLQDAINYWTIASYISPTKATIHQNLASTYEKMGNRIKAFKHYELFLSYNNGNDRTAIQIRIKVDEAKKAGHHNLSVGFHYHKKKAFAKAATAFLKCIEVYPYYPQAYVNLGSIFYQTNKLNEAIQYWNDALEIKSDHSNTHCNLGIAYDKLNMPELACFHYLSYLKLTKGRASDTKQLETRISQLKSIIEQKPEILRKFVNDGDNFFKASQYEDAIKSYTKYLMLKPNGADSQSILKKVEESNVRLNPLKKSLEVALEMGDQYFKEGKYDKALAAYDRYLLIGPSGKDVTKVHRRKSECTKLISATVNAMLSNDGKK